MAKPSSIQSVLLKYRRLGIDTLAVADLKESEVRSGTDNNS